MLDYKDIIIKHYALHMSGRQIAAAIGASKSGVNDFLKAFEQCESLSYPLPAGITNYGIAELVYGRNPEGADGRGASEKSRWIHCGSGKADEQPEEHDSGVSLGTV